MLGIALPVVAAIVVIVLGDQDLLPRAWAYAVLPVAIVAAAASRVVTTVKAKATTDRRTSRHPDGPDVDEP